MKDKFWCGFDDKIIEIEPWNCPCCQRCWLITVGKLKGRCVYNGPYRGYVETRGEQYENE